MSKTKFIDRNFIEELKFKSSKSSGKGGQHLNKTDSRISLFFHINNSKLLSEQEKQKLNATLKNRLNKEGVLQIDVEKSRSQHQNKRIAIQLFYDIIESNLKEKKSRIATQPSKESIRKRLKQKRLQAIKKERRKKEDI